MPFGCNGRALRRCSVRSRSGWKSISCRPSSARLTLLRISVIHPSTARRPIARLRFPADEAERHGPVGRVPAPSGPNEPKICTSTRHTSSNAPESSRARANRVAARIGPTVWEMEGPMPDREWVEDAQGHAGRRSLDGAIRLSTVGVVMMARLPPSRRPPGHPGSRLTDREGVAGPEP